MEILIKQATVPEIEAIRTVAWKGWYPYYLQIITEEQIRYMYGLSYSSEVIQRQMEEGHRFFVLYADGLPAVMSGFSTFIPEKQIWKLHKLYADPQFHGKGLGKAMLDEVVKDVSKEGAKEIQLNVNKLNPTFHFYLEYGFTVKWEEDIPFGPYWMNDFRMGKLL